MDVNLPIWQQILSDMGLKKLGFKNGPTIPFLIGVYHHLGVLSFDELQNDTCLRKIFKEVLMSGDGIIGVTYCKDLDAKIVRRAQLDSHNTITLFSCFVNLLLIFVSELTFIFKRVKYRDRDKKGMKLWLFCYL